MLHVHKYSCLIWGGLHRAGNSTFQLVSMKLTSRQIFRERRGIAKQYLKDKIVSCVFGSRCETIIFPSNRSPCLRQRPYFFPWVYFPDSVTHTLQLGVRLFSLEFRRHECSHVETLFLVGCGSAFGLLGSHVRWSGLESRLSTDFIPRSMATCSCR